MVSNKVALALGAARGTEQTNSVGTPCCVVWPHEHVHQSGTLAAEQQSSQGGDLTAARSSAYTNSASQLLKGCAAWRRSSRKRTFGDNTCSAQPRGGCRSIHSQRHADRPARSSGRLDGHQIRQAP